MTTATSAAPHPATRLRFSADPNTIRQHNNSYEQVSNGDSHNHQRQFSNGSDHQNGHLTNYNCNGATINGHSKKSSGSESANRMGSVASVGAKKVDDKDDFDTSTNTNNNNDSATRLCKIGDVPKYLRFNPFILKGYRRPELSSQQCIYSLCYFHNETVNILTHGEFFFFIC